MDPNTGNVYTDDEVEMLGKRMQDMIPLRADEARILIAERQEGIAAFAERKTREQEKRQRRKKNKTARAQRKRNR